MSSTDGAQVVLHARNISPELKKKFKIWCVERDISLQKGLAMLIEAAIGDKEKESENE